MVNIVFTILGIIIGSGATIILQLVLRKEKFKEIIYKEKLAIYNELTERLYNLLAIYVETYNSKVKNEKSLEMSQLDKLFIETNNAGKFISSKSFMISKEVYKSALEIIIACGENWGLLKRKAGIEEVVQPDMVMEHYKTMIDYIRQELGIEPISKEIKETIIFSPDKIFKIPKDKTKKNS